MSGSPETFPEEMSQESYQRWDHPIEPIALEPMAVSDISVAVSDMSYGEASLNDTGHAVGALAEFPESPTVEEVFTPVPPDMLDGDRPRSTIAEWTITILLLLFLTTTLVQAYVIPTGSMEDTLLIGDHLLVDKTGLCAVGCHQ